MSRNNKNATRMAKAREMSKARQGGNKGAAKTQPLHGKRHTYRTNPEMIKRLDEQSKELRARAEENEKRLAKLGTGKLVQIMTADTTVETEEDNA